MPRRCCVTEDCEGEYAGWCYCEPSAPTPVPVPAPTPAPSCDVLNLRGEYIASYDNEVAKIDVLAEYDLSFTMTLDSGPWFDRELVDDFYYRDMPDIWKSIFRIEFPESYWYLNFMF